LHKQLSDGLLTHSYVENQGTPPQMKVLSLFGTTNSRLSFYGSCEERFFVRSLKVTLHIISVRIVLFWADLAEY